MAFNDPNQLRILGHRWREGKTPEDYSVTLGFEVPGCSTRTSRETSEGTTLAIVETGNLGETRAVSVSEVGPGRQHVAVD